MAHIGIMGGTFDPVHNGHLMLGRQALAEYGPDEVWFMPSGLPPHKKGHRIAPPEDRLAMVRLAVSGIRGFVCSDFELQRPGLTYSSDTLRLLTEEYPAHTFSFIIGADSFFEIERWHCPQDVMRMAGLFVACRAYDRIHPSMEAQAALLSEKYGARIQFLHCPETEVSSSEIRELVNSGGDIRGLVPGAVADYIAKHGLYRSCAKHQQNGG